jgi:mRNA-degrading endonuclease RelE of RelBE toxin-antitoxin system
VTDPKLLAITEKTPTPESTPDVNAEWKDLKKNQREAIRDMQAIDQSRRAFETQQNRLETLEDEVKSLRLDKNELVQLRERRRLHKALTVVAILLTGIGTTLTTVFSGSHSTQSQNVGFAIGVALAIVGILLSAVLAWSA